MSIIKALEMNKEEGYSSANSNINENSKFIFDKENRGYIAYKFDSYYIIIKDLTSDDYKKQYHNHCKEYGIHIPLRRNRRKKLEDIIYIEFTLTRKEHRKKGVFKRMFLQLVELARREQRVIHLHANKGLLELYHKVGFRTFKFLPYHSSHYLLTFEEHLHDDIPYKNIILNYADFDESLYDKDDSSFTFEDLIHM